MHCRPALSAEERVSRHWCHRFGYTRVARHLQPRFVPGNHPCLCREARASPRSNGEMLPRHSSFRWPNQRVSKFDPAGSDPDYLEFALADFPPTGSRLRETSGLTNARIGETMTQLAWNTLALPPPAEGPVEVDLIDRERPRQAALRANRRSHRRPPSVRQREEKNPIALTYRSINRAIRSLFGDTQTKKKRSTSKRL